MVSAKDRQLLRDVKHRRSVSASRAASQKAWRVRKLQAEARKSLDEKGHLLDKPKTVQK
jgi:hypothetical protein